MEVPTQQEIVDRINERDKRDMMGWEVGEYYEFLDFEHVKPFLKEGVKESDIDIKKLERPVVIKIMKEYMPFAIGKMEDERGLSAIRSIMHYVAWTWLAGDKELSDKLDKADYSDYGKALLQLICKKYDFEFTRGDE